MRREAVLVCVVVVAAALCAPGTALAKERSFDIPRQPANRAILQFARQASIQIIAPGSRLRGLRTKSVKGRFEVRRALERMLEGTGIRIVADSNNTITLGVAPARSRRSPQTGAAATDGKPTKPRYSVGRRLVPRSRQRQNAAGRVAATKWADNGYILVTGSRLKTNGSDSPVPLTVVGSRLARNLGHSNTSDIVRLIPQNIATQSDATSGTRLSADIGAAYANLRGLNPTFGTRTLTLVNSRRFVPSSTGGQVDLNLIPSILIARVETITGGASAAYGSDAVAGVVNIILDNELEGLKGQIDYGQTAAGDGQSFYGAAAYGLNFADGRGHFMIGGEYQRNRGISHCSEVREWCAEGWSIFRNEANIERGTLNTPDNVSGYNVPGSSGYGLPNYVVARHGGLIYNSKYGAIRNLVREGYASTRAFNANFPDIEPPLSAVNKVFTPDGRAVVDYDPGDFGPKTVGGLSRGGDNSSAYADQRIQTPLERHTTYVAAEYELTDRLRLYTELTYAERKSQGQSLTAATRSTMAIKPDNAFLPQVVADSLNGSAFSLGKDVDGELDNRISVDAQVFRGLVGASGDLFSGWTWDAYYQFGDNKRQSSIRYSRNNDALAMAIDAVWNPNDPSRIICRPLSPETLAAFTLAYQAELQSLYESCAPLNLFGQGNMSQAAIDFAWQDVGEDFKYSQHVLAGSVQGELFGGWGAGPISAAVGFDYRDEKGDVMHGGVNPNAYAFSFGLDYAGMIKVIEGFLEMNVPVFSDSALGKFFELSGAIRYSRNKATDTLADQSRTVNATSWKVGGIYDVTDDVRFRATQSRDIRAAGFRELFRKTAPTDEGTAQARVNNSNIKGPDKVDPTPIYTGGNFGLSPEKADTTTAGAVFTPTFLPGFQMSIDWYQIKLKDAIANLNGQRVTDLCIDFDVLCERLSFASPTNITRIDAGQANVGRITLRGFDFEASYHLPLTDLWSSANGSIDFRFLLNHQYHFGVRQGPGLPTVDYAGQSGPRVDGGDFHPTPKWLWNALLAYDANHFNATVTVRYIGAGALNKDRIGPDDSRYDPALPNSVSNNLVNSATYVNLAMSYEIPFGSDDSHNVEIFGAIENLLGKKPPVAPGGGVSEGATAYPTNPVFFDTFGMRWKAGMRFKF